MTSRIACPAASSSRSGSRGGPGVELEQAIGERTAGVIHLVSPFTSPPGMLGFEEVCRIAHARGVPVLVDAASMIPPRDNLFRYLRGGADLVIYSGGKGIRGPQSTGILAGRRDLVRAATLNASPNQAIGRAAKTSKEEIVGLVTALELFLAEDEKAEMERFRAVASIVDGIADIPGLRAVVEQDPMNRVLPNAVIYFEPSWTGPSGRAVQLALAAGDPHIYVQQGPHQGGYVDEIAVDPINLQPGDEAIIARRLREELAGADGPRPRPNTDRRAKRPSPGGPCVVEAASVDRDRRRVARG